MPVVFSDFCQTFEPFLASDAVPGVAGFESQLSPLDIRSDSSAPLGRPETKPEVIKVATSFPVERREMHIGVEGIGPQELRRLNPSIPEAFELRLDQTSTGTQLDACFRVAVKVEAHPASGEQVPQSRRGRDDPSVGGVVNYGDQVRREIERLGPTVARFTIGDTGKGLQTNVSANSSQADVVAEVVAENTPGEAHAISAASAWDVFKTRSRSSVLVFQDNQLELEQSE
ncbi:type IV secretion system protein VirB1 [Agrobacterium fabrum]|uniref:type IV secretion system protein VirB1 n=1 Tax=Agrobacterium fabrum TaxID=1176649 RepID=UPI00273DF260|nr:type IV secretion system protein VirB1 [Agrobacterium fabrum]WLP57213.1 type IV secretion system protein VirB1 [Agrobacterium fabrum]